MVWGIIVIGFICMGLITQYLEKRIEILNETMKSFDKRLANLESNKKGE